MSQKYNIPFFTERINEIGRALMHDLRNTTEKIPTDIITVLKTDEEGRIWFYIRRPTKTGETPLSFPASLQFIRKGKNFFIKITGTAQTTRNIELANYFISYSSNHQNNAILNLSLVEMKINSIEYAEYNNTYKENSLTSWIRILFSPFFTLPTYSTHHKAKIIFN